MSVERELIMSILRLTGDGPVSKAMINTEANVPLAVGEKLLQKMQCCGLVYLQNGFVEADSIQRVKLAVRAIQCGADLETTSIALKWKEFESMAAMALEQNGYAVARNVFFKCDGRRYEIDVIGCKKPFAICIDCKHWRHGLYPSAEKRIANEQTERTSMLAKSMRNLKGKIECASWDHVSLIPVVVSIFMGRSKLHDKVPIVSVLQLQDFLNQLPICASELYVVTV